MRGARARLARGERRLKRERPGVDVAVVPGLLLLVARDLALYDPPRVLAWRLGHDARLAELARRLGPLAPAPSGGLDRDPIALLLAALAVLLALAYAVLAVTGARAALRGATLALAAALLVVLPSLGLVWLGAAGERPYGQDGGVVQLPLAIDKLLAGESPYGADYSGTILARQARVSSFWEQYGGNPILRHHAYLPGTHLVMLPFQLTLRSMLGFFDPRFVTLLFYGIAALLAARIPGAPDARLAAAAVVALNPLVYWHQIFGANDLVFVAMLLAVALLARSGRPAAAGALLGLACATKQLAWPFAPFLLLVLSGARSFRELASPAAWRRLRAPLAAAALVFFAVVVPVAALDLGAFWGDIVGYNAGLPGADNYPLGGTPGFGFANFLIYFGGVASLRDYFPFSVFYALLVPLGVLLVRAQLRHGGVEGALVAGSAALAAALYFSRVVHPNYLVAAAVLLPLAALAERRHAGLALVPLLLFAAGVEIAQHELLRGVWEQAAAAGWPARLGGLVAALGPRAGPQLSRDPLGLLFSAGAAGLAVAYLATAAARLADPAERAAARGVTWREPFLAAAALFVVAAPTLVLMEVGARTGIVRAQDATVVQAQADAGRLLAARSPFTPPPETTPRGRQAFSASFRLEPPAEQLPERPLFPPGVAVLAALGSVAGQPDPRAAGLVAMAALALLLAVRLRRSRPALLAVVLASPPLAVGTLLGSPAVLSLTPLVGLWAAARGGGVVSAGVLAGLAAALDHRAALAALPLLVLTPDAAGARMSPPQRARALLTAVAAYAVVVGPVAALDPGAALARLVERPVPGPGLGLLNLLAYRGSEESTLGFALAAAAPLVAALLALALLRVRASAPTVAGLASLAAIVLAPSLSPEAVAIPLVLLALGSVDAGGAVDEAVPRS